MSETKPRASVVTNIWLLFDFLFFAIVRTDLYSSPRSLTARWTGNELEMRAGRWNDSEKNNLTINRVVQQTVNRIVDWTVEPSAKR